ncbi:NgoMIV family type II restriction endonuclease [Paenibacillus favisporus]|uniref:NgoMIV family type II restriction endonuclease n=1 Tax=Paenibacillus favisporus TaxID=221028 RepID=UPI00197EA3C6|nr:NgoMIV family type II restriction endonuclease [Paenibacillus favisporus]
MSKELDITNSEALIAKARKNYHASLLAGPLSINNKGIPSNADGSNGNSVLFAKSIMDALNYETTREKAAGQTSGNQFEEINVSFLKETFLSLGHIRPGGWSIKKVGSRSQLAIAEYEQYHHLVSLRNASKSNPELAAALGNDYVIAPDVVIEQSLWSDDEINNKELIVDSSISNYTAIRAVNGGKPLLHASISSKWTIRSDRSQNSRSEALNLIRNRKGHLPHIVVVTAEPLPSRLSSIALGTGDIDCVYHFALHELINAVEIHGSDDSKEMLKIMVDGKRLKDISDLPLDLAQ